MSEVVTKTVIRVITLGVTTPTTRRTVDTVSTTAIVVTGSAAVRSAVG